MKFFIDSSFIISLFRSNDPNHNLAKNNKSIIDEHECYISNGILREVITVLMLKTKNMDLVNLAYSYLHHNFIIVDEYRIKDYNDKVFSVFQKYNMNSMKLSFIDCSSVIIASEFGLDYIVTFDKDFKLFEDTNLLNLN